MPADDRVERKQHWLVLRERLLESMKAVGEEYFCVQRWIAPSAWREQACCCELHHQLPEALPKAF